VPSSCSKEERKSRSRCNPPWSWRVTVIGEGGRRMVGKTAWEPVSGNVQPSVPRVRKMAPHGSNAKYKSIGGELRPRTVTAGGLGSRRRLLSLRKPSVDNQSATRERCCEATESTDGKKVRHRVRLSADCSRDGRSGCSKHLACEEKGKLRTGRPQARHRQRVMENVVSVDHPCHHRKRIGDPLRTTESARSFSPRLESEQNNGPERPPCREGQNQGSL